MPLVFLAILMLAIVMHEVAHGYAALLLGDPTAKNEGRLTLNPLPHIDLLGTIIIPAFLLLTGSGLLFGWAKPVPYNPYNLKGKHSEALVAAAGPAINIAIAVLFGIVYRFGIGILPESILHLSAIIVPVNLFLALFNLIPIPPLDGSKIIMTLLPHQYRTKIEERIRSLTITQNIMLFVITLAVLSFFVLDYITEAVSFLTTLFTGTVIF